MSKHVRVKTYEIVLRSDHNTSHRTLSRAVRMYTVLVQSASLRTNARLGEHNRGTAPWAGRLDVRDVGVADEAPLVNRAKPVLAKRLARVVRPQNVVVGDEAVSYTHLTLPTTPYV